LPGLIRATNEWFRIYKIPDGKPENQFAFSGEAKNKKYAMEIIHETHEAWRRLINGDTPPGEIRLLNVTNTNSSGYVHKNDPAYVSLPQASNLPPAPIDPSISKWFYISSATI